MFNPLYSDGFSHTDSYNKDGIVHYIFKGSKVDIFKLISTSVSEYCIYHSKQCRPWVFTVCQTTNLGVASITHYQMSSIK